jgi:hypothetical protein
MEAYEGVEVKLHSFLTSALEGGEWLVSRSGLLCYMLDKSMDGSQSRPARSNWVRTLK